MSNHENNFLCPSCHPLRTFVVLALSGPIAGVAVGTLAALLFLQVAG